MKYFVYCRKSTEGDDRQALSIPAQVDEIKRMVAALPEIEIVEWLEEKKSAKAPGRPVYSSMIERIEAGEADGVIAWHPDRLARNSVDGGWLIYLVDRNVIKDLKFVSYSFEKSPQGMFMLQIMFGQSKYYVDALSVNVKRGIRKKVEMGWRPNKPPLGYLNDRDTGTIVSDPVLYPLIRRMWDLLLSGVYSVTQIRTIATEEWGFRTPVTKNGGGKKLTRSGFYKLFASPFYAGILVWNGEWHPGKHQPMITPEDFDRARQLLNRAQYARPTVHDFAYTGLIRCSCGLAITAEEKRKPSGRTYVYYHCTRRAEPRCRQPAVRAEIIDAAILALLKEITLGEEEADLIAATIEDNIRKPAPRAEGQGQALSEARDRTRRQLDALTDMRLRDLLDDGEYLDRKRGLQKTLAGLERSAAETERDGALRLELERAATLFRKYAAKWFFAGSSADKRLILQTIGSNPVLSDKRLSIDVVFPFEQLSDPAYCPRQWGVWDAIGTLVEDCFTTREFIKQIATLKERAERRHAGEALPAEKRHYAPRGRPSWRRPPALREAAQGYG